MTDQLTEVQQCDPAFVKLVTLLQTSAYSAGASGGCAGREEMTEARKAIIDCYGSLQRRVTQLERREYICKSCGLRKDGEIDEHPEF